MSHEFTPAASRALQAAMNWSLAQGLPAVSAQALLLGLLEESESRAVVVLARAGIGQSAVLERWPSTRPERSVQPTPPVLSATVEELVTVADAQLDELPRPFALASEHLLLALLASGCEVGDWLRRHGMSADELMNEIYAQQGITAGPVETEEELAPPKRGRESFSAAGSPEARKQDTPKKTPDPVHVDRLLDAAANRASEALRVVEDYLRFVLDDGHLCGQCKQLRHQLNAAISNLPMNQRLAMRDTQQDVGTEISAEKEYQRLDAADVLGANFARLQQSLRSLEEFVKLNQPDVAARLEQLRYQVYTLQKAVGVTQQSIARLADARLYVLVDGDASGDEFETKCRTLVEAGVHALQLRDKRLTDRDLLKRATLLRKITAPTPTLFVMNDRPDLAVLAAADGVHVGQDELSVHQVRRIVGGQMLVGVSTHNIQQARQAVLDGANYIGVGPTFPSATKPFETFAGLDFVRQVAHEIRLPAFAIGGITLENISQVIEAGLHRVAVAGEISNAKNPGDVVRALLRKLHVDSP